MVDFLLVLLLSVHVVLAHIAAAGPLVACGLAAAARRGGPAWSELGRQLSVVSLQAFAAAIALGGVMAGWLWLADDGRLAHAVGRLPAAKLWFAAGELVFYGVCQGLHVAWWDAALRGGWPWRLGHHLLAVLGATNLLYHFPPLFVILSLPEWTALPDAGATPSVYRAFVARPDVLALSGHHWLAAIAVAGVALMTLAALRTHRAGETEATTLRFAIGWGARLALAATLLQLPVGIAVLVTQPRQAAVLGGDGVATALFLGSLAAALSLMHHLAAAAFGDGSAKTVRRAALLLAATIVLMTGTLDRLRTSAKQGYTLTTRVGCFREASPARDAEGWGASANIKCVGIAVSWRLGNGTCCRNAPNLVNTTAVIGVKTSRARTHRQDNA